MNVRRPTRTARDSDVDVVATDWDTREADGLKVVAMGHPE